MYDNIMVISKRNNIKLFAEIIVMILFIGGLIYLKQRLTLNSWLFFGLPILLLPILNAGWDAIKTFEQLKFTENEMIIKRIIGNTIYSFSEIQGLEERSSGSLHHQMHTLYLKLSNGKVITLKGINIKNYFEIQKFLKTKLNTINVKRKFSIETIFLILWGLELLYIALFLKLII
ncbi:MAG: hypothetical protein JXR64_13010 [Spirochaetales bacterium]|nr:hypothetical protein [Spirochaetales bacterium]